jgi:hypothetical protein
MAFSYASEALSCYSSRQVSAQQVYATRSSPNSLRVAPRELTPCGCPGSRVFYRCVFALARRCQLCAGAPHCTTFFASKIIGKKSSAADVAQSSAIGRGVVTGANQQVATGCNRQRQGLRLRWFQNARGGGVVGGFAGPKLINHAFFAGASDNRTIGRDLQGVDAVLWRSVNRRNSAALPTSDKLCRWLRCRNKRLSSIAAIAKISPEAALLPYRVDCCRYSTTVAGDNGVATGACH